MYLSRISSIFRQEDLLTAFPTVRVALKAHPEWVQTHEQNKVFYACHAASWSGHTDEGGNRGSRRQVKAGELRRP
jgi:hypothetical protein